MGLYRYEALNLFGKNVRGTVDAGTPAEARSSLRQKGYFTTTLLPAVAEPTRRNNGVEDIVHAPTWNQISGSHLDRLSSFSRHLALLLKSGLPLSQALTIMAEQLEDLTFRNVVQDVSVRVKEGASLEEALAVHPKIFPDIFVCIAQAGGASGSLPQLLTQLSSYYMRQKKLRDRLISALTYPALMCGIGGLVLVFLLAFVVPKVTTVLIEQHRALPWPTEVLLAVSSFVQNYWWLLLLFIAFSGWVLSAVRRSSKGARILDRLSLRLPLIGDLLRKQAIARWADTMSNLISSGIPVAQSLAIVKGSVGNRVLSEDIVRMEKGIIDGQDLSAVLKISVAFPKSIAFVVGVGEESGELPRVLKEVAESYNDDVEVVSMRLADLVNPILIVFLGVTVGFIVAAILLPITDFSQM
jgi:general secretion pathway protein F